MPEFHFNLPVLTEWRTAGEEDVEDDTEAPAVHLAGVDPLPQAQFPAVLLTGLNYGATDVWGPGHGPNNPAPVHTSLLLKVTSSLTLGMWE